MDGQTDRRIDGQMDGWTDGWMEWMSICKEMRSPKEEDLLVGILKSEGLVGRDSRKEGTCR
jgi:hypothetical protein